MYRYVEDKRFVSKMRQFCGSIMQELCHTLKRDWNIGTVFFLVGSGARNLILQNENCPIDLDYNLEFVRLDPSLSEREVKEAVRCAFNKVLRRRGLPDCQDSTAALTTATMSLYRGNPALFSMDVCIVRREPDGTLSRLIHQKNGSAQLDRYIWNTACNSDGLREKVQLIRQSGKWGEVRQAYLSLKNQYLRRNDLYHPSFICYIEAVNQVYCTMTNKTEYVTWAGSLTRK